MNSIENPLSRTRLNFAQKEIYTDPTHWYHWGTKTIRLSKIDFDTIQAALQFLLEPEPTKAMAEAGNAAQGSHYGTIFKDVMTALTKETP